jgi:hypothetical protein
MKETLVFLKENQIPAAMLLVDKGLWADQRGGLTEGKEKGIAFLWE